MPTGLPGLVAVEGFVLVGVDPDGHRLTPRLHLLPLSHAPPGAPPRFVLEWLQSTSLLYCHSHHERSPVWHIRSAQSGTILAS